MRKDDVCGYIIIFQRDAMAREKMVSACMDITNIRATYFASNLRRSGITEATHRYTVKNEPLKLLVKLINPFELKLPYKLKNLTVM